MKRHIGNDVERFTNNLHWEKSFLVNIVNEETVNKVGVVMRRSVINAVVVFSVAIAGLRASLLGYTQAEDLVLFERDPFTTQATLDSDYRLRAMGGLDLPIDDESNKVGTFKYGQAPVGLAQDYPQSKAEIGLISEGGILKDKELNDTSFTGDVAEVPHASLQGMLAVRTGTSAENHGAFVAGVTGEWYKFDYNPDYMNAAGFRTLDNSPNLSNFNVAYGHQLGRFLFGLGIESVNSTPTDIDATLLNGISTNVKADLDIVDVTPSVGYVAPLTDGALSFTLSPRIHNQEEIIRLNGDNEIETDQDGTLFDIGAHYGNGKVLQTALYLTFGGIEGDITNNGVITGSADMDRADVRFRLYGRPQKGPFSIGFVMESLTTKSEAISNRGVKITDDKTIDNTLGGGIAFHFPEDKGLVGIELRLLHEDLEDGLNSANDEKTEGSEIRLGGEHILGSKLWLRAGFNVKSLDVEPQGGPTLNATVSQLTFGAEYNFTMHASLALNFASTGIVSEGSSTAGVDEQEFGAGTLQLLGKFHFGESAVQ